MQQYSRYFEYLKSYIRLVYQYYSKDGSASLINYYNINMDIDVMDKDKLESGPYQFYGEDNTGITFTCCLLLPVYYIDSLEVAFTGDERGYIHEATGSITFPSSYGLQPYEHDLVQFIIDPNDINSPPQLYEVIGIEMPNDFPEETFYKCHIKSAPANLSYIANQVTNLTTWYEPAKKILPLDKALRLYHLNNYATEISQNIQNMYYYRPSALMIQTV